MTQPNANNLSPAPLVQPRIWHLAPYGWRFARHLTSRRIDRILRSRILSLRSPTWRARLDSMDLPDAAVSATLSRIRSLAAWTDEWTATAQYFLGEARRAGREPGDESGAVATRHAALCYHIASWFAFEDPRIARTCRASAVRLFGKAMMETAPDTRRVLVPWRTRTLPAYLATPSASSWTGPRPLVVLLNGVTTTKEELILWRETYVARGMAVLALDWPGTGELFEDGPNPDHDDFTDGVLDLARHDRDLDPDRVALLGFSLGGAMAVRAAALDRRIAAVVAVTPPYDVRPWIPAASPLLREQFAAWSADEPWTTERADGFALDTVLPRLKCPLLVFGGGQDLVVPPTESIRLAATHGENATLVWYEHAGHGLYEVLDQWTSDSARWLEAVFADVTGATSTQVEFTPSHELDQTTGWDGPQAFSEPPTVNEPAARES